MNKIYFRACWLITLSLLPWLVHAAGLGKLTLGSYLGQPLKAEIELVSLTEDEIESLKARVASPEAFRQAGITYAPYHSSLIVSVEKRVNGQPYIQISSSRSVDEPFVNLLIELDGLSGRLLREYTVLLDPPEAYAVQPARPIAQLMPVSLQTIPETRAANQPRGNLVQRPEAVAVSPYKEGMNTYGPVARGETLTRIARQVMPAGVDLNQMLVALYQANQDAFFDGNMNLLKIGAILRIPDQNEISTISQTEAGREIKAQTANWYAYRQRIADASLDSPSKSELRQSAEERITTTVVEESPAVKQDSSEEVLILSKGEQLESTQVDENYESGETRTAQDYLRMMEEDAIAKDRALKEANERVALLEQNIERLQRLLELKSAGMSEVQTQAEQTLVQEELALPEAPVLAEATEAAPEDSIDLAPKQEMDQPEQPEVSVPAQPALPESAANQVLLPDSSEHEEAALFDQITDLATDNLEWVGGAFAVLLTSWLGISIFRRRREKNGDIDDDFFDYADETPKSNFETTTHLTGFASAKTEGSNNSLVEKQDSALKSPEDSKFFKSEQSESDLSESASEFFFGKNINETLAKERDAESDHDRVKIELSQSEDISTAPDHEIKFEMQNVDNSLSTVSDDSSLDTNESGIRIIEEEPLSRHELALEAETKEMDRDSSSEEKGLTFNIDFSDDIKASSGSVTAMDEVEPLSSQGDNQLARFNLADIKLDLDEEPEKTSQETVSAVEEGMPWDEAAVKIDLAKAYLEMDDKEGAKEILEEVMKEGNEAQQTSAKTMLESLK